MLLRLGEWLSPKALAIFAGLSAHPGYSQQFCSRQMLHIADYLIPGLI
ncbi:hypothetical protein GOC40_28680 [Sinorhizobium meliloti]|nr:hypothetical protein [Sinorhizobium meliloti]